MKETIIKKEKVICYYHDDMDGIASAAIVKSVYPQAKLIKVNYGDKWNVNDVIDSICIVVDFSFDDMEELKQYPNVFCWIDHHKSAMERNEELWDNEKICGFRSLEKAGCELTWNWFYPRDEMPSIIKFIGDRDIWKFEYKDTKIYHEALTLEIDKPQDLIKYIENDRELPELFDKGLVLYNAKQKRIKKKFESGSDCSLNLLNETITSLEYTNTNFKCLIVNSPDDISDLGNYICKIGYDIGIIWSVKSGNIIVSLRSQGDIDVSKIAEHYGGGGHKNAASFTLDSFDVLKNFAKWN